MLNLFPLTFWTLLKHTSTWKIYLPAKKATFDFLSAAFFSAAAALEAPSPLSLFQLNFLRPNEDDMISPAECFRFFVFGGSLQYMTSRSGV